MSEPLNSAQIILADGIAERVTAALREDAAASPLKMFQAELMRTIAKAVVEVFAFEGSDRPSQHWP